MAAEGCNIAGLSNSGSLSGTLNRDRRDRQMRDQNKQATDVSDDDLDEMPDTHVHERGIKSDKVLNTKPEEDRRRRTIIVEKKKGSYGFTLQSYGIHYKKEQEIEMITYVDYVEYGGPAYKAGMREGDVILSINGTDVEKADHKTLVAFIKDCDTRMRMVVLFEDCVRKVELHMRYIQLQNILQGKINELERVCLQERELLQGKWKTHSLPARKKINVSPTEGDSNVSPDTSDMPNFSRPTLSTEDVMNFGRQKPTIIPPPAQFMLTYQYLDPNYRYVLKPSTSSSSGEYFISTRTSRSPDERCYILARTNSKENAENIAVQKVHHHCQSPKHSATEQNHESSSRQVDPRKTSKSGRHCHGHSCNPCIGNFGKKTDKSNDNVSLDAYDLASPCCDTHCVPTRRRSRHHKEHHHKHKHRDKDNRDIQRPRSQSHASPTTKNVNHQHHQNQPHHSHSNDGKSNRSRYFDLTAGLASRCSLHSCNSSEFAPADSSASYTTSLSTDTLYWDPQSDSTTSRQHSTKSRQSSIQGQNRSTGTSKQHPTLQQPHGIYQHQYHLHTQPIPQSAHIYHQQYVQKPKSWDNLTTKAFGGYGFGYGYLDTAGPKPTIKMQVTQQRHSIPRKNPYGRYSTFTDIENYAPPPSQFVEETTTTTITTKSTENLLNAYNNVSDTNLRCDCTDSRVANKKKVIEYQYQQHPNNLQKIDYRNAGYYSNLPKTNNKNTTRHGPVATISEVTRL